MMEYKVCFHLSHNAPWKAEVMARLNKTKKSKATKSHSKMHYCGNTLEEAVEKIRSSIAFSVVRGNAVCTSMWIMRGRQKGLNIKWDEYHKEGEAKALWERELEDAERLLARYRAEGARWL